MNSMTSGQRIHPSAEAPLHRQSAKIFVRRWKGVRCFSLRRRKWCFTDFQHSKILKAGDVADRYVMKPPDKDVFFSFLRFFLNHRLDCKMDVLRFISGLKFLENYRANNQFIYFRWCSFEKGCLEMCHISEDFSLFSSSPCQGERTAGVPPTGTGRARLVDNVVRKNGGIFVFVPGWTRHAPKKQNQLRRWLPFFQATPNLRWIFLCLFFGQLGRKRWWKNPRSSKRNFKGKFPP